MGLLINALGNGLAVEKLVDPEAVPDRLFGDMLVLIFKAFEALIREDPSAVDPQRAISSQKPKTERKGAKNG